MPLTESLQLYTMASLMMMPPGLMCMVQRSIDPGQIIHTTLLRELKLRGVAPRHQCQNRKFAPSLQGAKFLHLRFR